MHNGISISENANGHILPLRGCNLPISLGLANSYKGGLRGFLTRASTRVIIRVITDKIAAAHSPGVPLSASTEANIASMRAWTALFTLLCSSAPGSSGLLEIMVADKPT